VNRALSAAAHRPDKEKPPRRNPGGKCESRWRRSALDGIAALAIFALAGRDEQSHFLSDCAGEEPADGMRLPARCSTQRTERRGARLSRSPLHGFSRVLRPQPQLC